MISKRSQQNKRQKHGFDIGFSVDEQHVDSRREQYVHQLHVHVEVQLKRLSGALFVNSFCQTCRLRAVNDIFAAGFFKLFVGCGVRFDLADPNALKGRFVPLAEYLFAEEVECVFGIIRENAEAVEDAVLLLLADNAVNAVLSNSVRVAYRGVAVAYKVWIGVVFVVVSVGVLFDLISVLALEFRREIVFGVYILCRMRVPAGSHRGLLQPQVEV